MRLAVTDIFAARWSERIHDEWIRNLLSVYPETPFRCHIMAG